MGIWDNYVLGVFKAVELMTERVDLKAATGSSPVICIIIIIIIIIIFCPSMNLSIILRYDDMAGFPYRLHRQMVGLRVCRCRSLV